MKKIFKIALGIFIAASLSITGYYTYRLWAFANKVSKAFEYTYSAIDCLIQQDGNLENDVDILFRGYKSRKAYYKAVNKQYPGLYSKNKIEDADKRFMYNSDIPECNKFYSEQRCWILEAMSEKSVVNCGPHFGYTEDDIKKFKADPSKGKEISEEVWKRRAKERK